MMQRVMAAGLVANDARIRLSRPLWARAKKHLAGLPRPANGFPFALVAMHIVRPGGASEPGRFSFDLSAHPQLVQESSRFLIRQQQLRCRGGPRFGLALRAQLDREARAVRHPTQCTSQRRAPQPGHRRNIAAVTRADATASCCAERQRPAVSKPSPRDWNKTPERVFRSNLRAAIPHVALRPRAARSARASGRCRRRTCVPASTSALCECGDRRAPAGSDRTPTCSAGVDRRTDRSQPSRCSRKKRAYSRTWRSPLESRRR